MKRRIAVVSVGRSDYGLYLPVLRAIEKDPGCELLFIAAAGHFSPAHGNTIREIESDGIEIRERVPMLLSADSTEAAALSLGIGVAGFAGAYHRLRPDILLLLGDRTEMLAAAVAALPMKIPVAHIHGGELTEGAIDDAARHAITKLSHVHFAAAAPYAQRIAQMGEQPSRIFLTGSPAIDGALSDATLSRETLEKEFGLSLGETLLVTYHPVTLDQRSVGERIALLVRVLEKSGCGMLITYPNADVGYSLITQSFQELAKRNSRVRLEAHLGRPKYLSLQKYVAAMVGNSSSGLVEASVFRLPVVNLGDRQRGRLRPQNVIDADEQEEAMEAAMRRALDPAFRKSLTEMELPYGSGDAARRILEVLTSLPLDGSLLRKPFHDLPAVAHAVLQSR